MKAAPKGVAMAKTESFAELFDATKQYNDTEKAIAALDEGWARAALCLRTGGMWRFGHGQSFKPQSLLEVKTGLDVWKSRFDSGDTLALLQAVEVCANENVPMPTWLAIEFSKALHAFLQPGDIHSLDSVFASPNLPTNTASKAASARQDWVLGAELWRACWDEAIKNKSATSLDSVLDTVLSSKKWGVQKRKARTLVLRVDESQAEHLHKREKQPLARFLEKRRKT